MPNKLAPGATRSWDALTPELSEWILNAVSSNGFEKMTPVQASTIPLFMGNKDVVVEAVTGSGKTLAFLIPIVEKLLRLDEPIKRHHVGAIVISPTRELASQIHSVLVSFLGFHPPSAAVLRPPEAGEQDEISTTFSGDARKIITQLVVGGNQTPAQDLAQFLSRSPNFLIGTPGRLLELLSCQAVHCPQSSFEVLVLDEADRLLDLGFKDDLQKILQRLPKQRRTGLFSASVSEAVDQLIRVGLRNPVRISVRVKSESGAQDKRTPISLQMFYKVLKPSQKLPGLVQLLNEVTPSPQKSILYVSTCAAVEYLQHILPILLTNFTVVSLHGKLAQKVRDRNFRRFTESITPTVLVTTDVAARGLDIPLVDLVVQLDPPTDPKVFIHRCGRAGRAGRRGMAVVFLSPGSEENYVSFLAVRKSPVTPLEHPHITISDQDATNTTSTIRNLVITDLALHEKAQRAFVSWVQAYSKHQASSIFPVSQLDWEDLGNAWGLLKLPKMPELRNWDGDKTLGVNFNIEDLKYKDTAREKRRLTELDQNTAPHTTSKKKAKSEAWSEQKAMKETREIRREKRKARRENEKRSKMSEQELEEKLELDRMIGQVRAQTATMEEEWEGFSD